MNVSNQSRIHCQLRAIASYLSRLPLQKCHARGCSRGTAYLQSTYELALLENFDHHIRYSIKGWSQYAGCYANPFECPGFFALSQNDTM